MPKLDSIQTNFTAGELSPKVRGRVDISRYQNGAELLENMVVDIYGGASRAPGTAYVAPTAHAARTSRLIPFTFNRSAAYALEFGHQVMRVFKAGAGQVLVGGTPYQITTPYTDVQVQELRFAQVADTIFIAHPAYPIHMVRRLADDSWVITPAPFAVLPFAETGHVFPGVGLVLSLTTVGTGRTATASTTGAFMQADVGRRITYLTGVAIITQYLTSQQVEIEITSPFAALGVPAGQWVLEDSPQATLTPSAKGTVGQSITMTLDIQGWRATADVGRFVKVNRGLVQITGVTSPTVATGVVKADMDSNVAAQPGSWIIQAAAWGGVNGYPAAVTFNEQRLVAGGTVRYPNGIWGSRTGLYLDFTSGDQDTDSYFYALDGEGNAIEHLASVRALMVLTLGGEWTMLGGVEKPLTPTNVRAKDGSVYGTATARPVRVGDELLFVQRSGRKVRAMGYSLERDSYSAPNLTTLAEHITESGVKEMTFQQEPASLIWAVLNNGRMVSLTIDRDEGVTAWCQHGTDGIYESVCSVPAGEADEVWVVVRRVVNGQTVRYVEKLRTDYFVHCGIIGHDPAGSQVWGGLAHLEGKTVKIRADGTEQPDAVVIAGQVTLPRAAVDVQIGLNVTPRVKLLRPEVSTQTGTAQASQMRTHKVSVLFLNTVGATINGQRRATRQFGPSILDKPPAPLSGWDGVGELGWDTGESPIEITQESPMPFHILAVVRHWTTNS